MSRDLSGPIRGQYYPPFVRDLQHSAQSHFILSRGKLHVGGGSGEISGEFYTALIQIYTKYFSFRLYDKEKGALRPETDLGA